MATQYGEDIAVLKDQMKDVKDALTRIEIKLDAGAATYATKQELKTFKWLTIPIIILTSAVLTALVAFFFANIGSNNPTTSSTTTVNTPGGSTSTTSTKDGTPSATSSATAHSDAAKPQDSQTSNGGVDLTLPKVP